MEENKQDEKRQDSGPRQKPVTVPPSTRSESGEERASEAGGGGRIVPAMRSALKRPTGSGGWRQTVTSRKGILSAVFVVVFAAGLAGGYAVFRGDALRERGIGKADEASAEKEETSYADLTAIKVYYPFEGGLKMEARRVFRFESKNKMAEAALKEFFKGPTGAESYVPEEAKLLGIYNGVDGMLYIDLSHEFRSNFQGDALAEFLLLRGLYETVTSNVPGIAGLKVLLEGKEVESIGGHISLPGTLGEAVSHIMLEKHGRK